MERKAGLTNEQREWLAKMPPKRAAFCLAHAEDPKRSWTECAKIAGYKDAGAHTTAHRLLKNAEIKNFLDSLKIEAAEKAVMTRDEAVQILADIARTKIDDVVQWQHSDREYIDTETGEVVRGQTVWSLRPADQMGGAGVGAISELTAGKSGYKFKLHDRTAALKQLAAMLGWDAPTKTEISGPNGGPVETRDVPDEELEKRLKDMGLGRYHGQLEGKAVKP